MFQDNKELYDALDSVKESEGADGAKAKQMAHVGVSLGGLILNLLPEGPNKELAKQHLVECIFFCKQSLRLKK